MELIFVDVLEISDSYVGWRVLRWKESSDLRTYREENLTTIWEINEISKGAKSVLQMKNEVEVTKVEWNEEKVMGKDQ